ncbi:DNA replication and repair protein RecF [Prosthecochloris sp. ZM_2]|uniref:DNA replication/repair protein RecF n=1 Tax=Prosthecochloris sp. ZM_2 TaxID=2045206 RepID=UPI000DF74988|nr:DNA replication and repair protein RecF [Prosthecochloris sp. ZM_2]RNA65739.1 DNA replication and repair protein RecF [Prosthecochloris sp. ZM_2]
MKLNTIKLQHFRKHDNLEFSPSGGITLVYGPNGTGKSNILEAIHFCALARGMNNAPDRECMNFAADHFLLQGFFESDLEVACDIQVSYSPREGKRISLNKSDLPRFSDLIGVVPCVTFSPLELPVVNGPPGERRRFVDSALCQISRTYLERLQQYRRILQQRNALLSKAAYEPHYKQSIHLWTEHLAEAAAAVMTDRLHFLEEFSVAVDEVFSLMGIGETPSISYRSSLGMSGDLAGFDVIKDFIFSRFSDINEQEIQRKQTLIGPHRDDFLFEIDGKEVKRYASQGQMRTFLIALKIALQKYIFSKKSEAPVFLLDDIFSELDDIRVEKVLEVIHESGQAIITSASKKNIDFLDEVALHTLLNS